MVKHSRSHMKWKALKQLLAVALSVMLMFWAIPTVALAEADGQDNSSSAPAAEQKKDQEPAADQKKDQEPAVSDKDAPPAKDAGTPPATDANASPAAADPGAPSTAKDGAASSSNDAGTPPTNDTGTPPADDTKASSDKGESASSGTDSTPSQNANSAPTSKSDSADPAPQPASTPATDTNKADTDKADANKSDASDEAGSEKPADKKGLKAAPTRNATEIDSVSITVTPPEAGTHSTNAKAAISTSTPGLSVAHAYWHEFKGYTSADPAELTFVEGNSYYVVICLDVADGYTLKKGAGKPSLDIDACDYAFGGDTSVSGGTLDSAAFRSTERYDSEKLYIWAKATATAGSAQTVNMRVWTEGHGKILVNGSDYGTEFQGTWYEGTEVQAEAVPDEGYKLERWWIQKSPGPNARIYDTAITLVAGTDLVAEALFALETASVTITPPEAGTTAATAPQITLPDGAGYSLDTLPWGGQAAYWTTADSLLTVYPEALDESTVFEPGQTYYAYVRLAEDGDFIAATAGGSSFDTDLEVTGGTKAAQGNFAAWSEEHGNYMGIMAIIAVTIPEDTSSYDLTFEFLNLGTSAPLSDLVSSIKVNGANWPLPTSGMEVTKPIPAGSSVSATLKTAPGAMFNGAILDNDPTQSWVPSQDDTTLEITFTMPESNAKIVAYVYKFVTFSLDVNGGSKGPAWPGDTMKYPDYVAQMMISWPVDPAPVDMITGEVVAYPPTGAKYAGLEITDKNGTHTGVPGTTITGLNLSEGATIKYLWEKLPTLTLHWSSIDGVDLVDPIVIEGIEKGTKVYEALGTVGLNMMSHPFAKDGYIAADYKVNKPITEYAGYDVMDADWVDANAPIESDVDIYCIMLKAIDEAEVSLEAPLCGTETTTSRDSEYPDEWDFETQTNMPKLTPAKDSHFDAGAFWANEALSEETRVFEPYIGPFVGGQGYHAVAIIPAEYGYAFSQDARLTAKGATVDYEAIDPDGELIVASLTVIAAHDPAEPVEENIVEPTCTEPGSHDEVVYCKHCEAEISRATIEDPALGHDWDEGKVTTEPTCTETGVKTFICKRDPAHTKTEPVAALGHDWGAWETLSEPTCTEPGEEQHTCSRCGEKETREIAALGHDWGEWVVTKEPTETEEGIETRTCARCGETETRPIDKLVPEPTPDPDPEPTPDPDPMVISYRNTEGNGNVWTKGSGVTSDFTFKRSTNDSETFDHFEGIQVDGKDVDPENYTAEAGSVVVKLAPEYLETLALGKHRITAFFDDGNSAGANFTIVAKKATPSPTPSPTSKASSETTPSKTTPSIAGKTANTSDSAPFTSLCILALLAAAVMAGVRSRRVSK